MLDLRRVTDRFSVAPQIAPDDVAELRDRGFTLVISNRPDDEDPGQPTGAEIAASAAAAGLEFRHIPVAGGFPREAVAATAEALDSARGPVFAFCRSGTRSTLLWSLAQASNGANPEEIAAAAASAGYDIAPIRVAVEHLAATS
jgi:uncharacterized protein (TIGR01244 family)